MISKLDIRQIEKRVSWLPKFFYIPIQEISLEIAETMEHRRELEISGLDFKPIQPGAAWGEEWGSAWFKGTYEIDKNTDEAKILLQTETEGESIVYINNRHIAAIDREHKEIPLTDTELQFGSHELLIESYAGHYIPSVDPVPSEFTKGSWQKPTYRHCRLVRRNDAAWHLYFDMSTLFQTAQELPDDSLRKANIFKALSKAVNMITWDTPDIKRRDQDFETARNFLAPFLALPNGPTTPTLNVMGHAHIDIAWLWPLSETIRKCGRTFATQLHMMKEYPEYKFLQSQPQAYEYVEKYYPKLFQEIITAVNEGKWEANGGMWVESDTNVPSAESLIRQFLIGKTYFLEKFNKESTFLWLPDVFGYNGNLPQILRGCDVDYFVTSKIGWNQTNRFPYDLFIWRGIDGSEVLATYIKNTYNSFTDPKSIWATWREFNQKELTDTIIDSVGFGDGGGGITMGHMEYAKRLEDLEGVPKLRFGFAETFLKSLDKNRSEYPRWVGELYLELHRGTLTSQAWSKRNNRKCEFLLREAELFASAANLFGASYPSEKLLESWKNLLTNQFHDILPGSSIGRVYEDCDRIYGEIAETGYDIIHSSLDAISKKIPKLPRKTDAKRLTVFNTLNWDRTGRVSIPLEESDDLAFKIGNYTPHRCKLARREGLCIADSNGNRLPTQISGDKLVFLPKSIPGAGFESFSIEEGNRESDAICKVSATATGLENDFIAIKLDEHGQFVSIFDKEAKREVLPVGQKGNVLLLAEDLPNFWDAWDIDRSYRMALAPVYGEEKIEVIADGPIEAKVRVTRKFGQGSLWTQDIILGCESKQIDFETTVVWNETHRLLKVAFPIDVNATEASYEIQGGYIRRSTHENTSWDEAKFEVCGHKWADLSEEAYGAALMNDCKYAYECIDNEMRLTLLKSAIGPDPKADKGTHTFIYSFLPHIGGLSQAEVCLRAHELNVPYSVYTGTSQSMVSGLPAKMQLLKVSGGQVFLQAMKKSEKDNSLVLRFSELAGMRSQIRLTLPRKPKKVCETNMIERDIQILESSDSIKLEFRPFEIKSIRLIF
jgi:alpha-mannosidase